jgi:hypothetical protein
LSVAFLCYFSLAAFTFLLLESIVIAHTLVVGVVCPIAKKIVWLIALGFAVPFVYTVIAIPVLYKDLIPDSPKL